MPGLTPWDGGASVASQLRAAGALHALTEQGTLALRPSEGVATGELLRQAWRQTEVVRLRLVGARGEAQTERSAPAA